MAEAREKSIMLGMVGDTAGAGGTLEVATGDTVEVGGIVEEGTGDTVGESDVSWLPPQAVPSARRRISGKPLKRSVVEFFACFFDVVVMLVSVLFMDTNHRFRSFRGCG
jgi:hypothetical protein